VIQEPSEEEQMIRASVAQFVGREAAPDRLARLRHEGGGFDRGTYRQAGELGWLGMLVPEAYGGSAMPVRICAAAFEELGRAPLMGPVLTSGVIATLVILEGGSEAQQAALLPPMVAGERVAALAAMDSGRGWGPAFVTARARPDGGRIRIDGRKAFVPDAGAAELFICAARLPDDGPDAFSLFVVDAAAEGVGIHPLAGLPSGLSAVTFEAVSLPADALLGAAGAGRRILERATHRALPLLCAFMSGACQEIFDFTVEYAGQRSAFGQLIGRFQRVQDHVVELANQMDGARWMTVELVSRIEAGMASAADVHETAAVATEAYYQVCNFSHMVHAGPGTDLDHPLMGHTIASRALYQLMGTPDHHKRLMMDLRFPRGRSAGA
jgi:alkylation response protein AidB-like acyl-CoA dehydrogenase